MILQVEVFTDIGWQFSDDAGAMVVEPDIELVGCYADVLFSAFSACDQINHVSGLASELVSNWVGGSVNLRLSADTYYRL